MTDAAHLEEAVRPAQQRRSQETLRRIVAALAELLEDHTFEEVSVQMICERSGASVGSFYARVGSKEALLDHLRQHVYAKTEAQLDSFFDLQHFDGRTLAQMLDHHARTWVEIHRATRGVTRALIIEARRTPAFAEHARAFNDRLMKAATRAWLERKSEIRHPQPSAAVRHAFMMATSFAREAIVFSDMWPAYKPRSDRALARELSKLLTNYLAQEGEDR